jgi:hypothetical protein
MPQKTAKKLRGWVRQTTAVPQGLTWTAYSEEIDQGSVVKPISVPVDSDQLDEIPSFREAGPALENDFVGTGVGYYAKRLGNVIVLLHNRWSQIPLSKVFCGPQDCLLKIGMFKESQAIFCPSPANRWRLAML